GVSTDHTTSGWSTPTGTQASTPCAPIPPPAAWGLPCRMPSHGRTSPGDDRPRGRLLRLLMARAPDAITLAHLSHRVYASGSTPPVSDAGVIENHGAARDETPQRLCGSALVLTPCYYTPWRPCFCRGDCPSGHG